MLRTTPRLCSGAPVRLLAVLLLAGCRTEAPAADASDTADVHAESSALPEAAPSEADAPVVRSLSPGDRACYMELAYGDDTRQEEAVFELCEQTALVGKPVRLTRERTPILAMSCQGNPECTEQDTVDLIVGAVPFQ